MDELEQQLSQIRQFDYIHEHLFTSGQPTEVQLEQIKAYGISTIINLALSDSPQALAQEDRICLNLGLNYIHLPLLWDNPSAEQGILILDLIDHLVQSQRVWLHCNNNRHAACLMYLYRQFYMDIDLATAQEKLHQLWQPDETWTGFIHTVTLQLQGRKATQDLQLSLMNANHFAE